MAIPKSVLETEKSADKYLSWVESLISDEQKTELGQENIRLKKGIAKELMDEALPIGYFAKSHYKYSPEVTITLKIGNQHYDAIVVDKRLIPSAIEKIEVTGSFFIGAEDGYEDYLYRLHLHKTGEGGTGSLTSQGTKKTGLTTNLDRNMVSQDDVLEHERKTIQDAISRKVDKEQNHYEEKTALLISFDDIFAFDRVDNIKNIQHVIDDNISKLKASNFSLVAVVGMRKNLYIESEIK